jgi:hypothetical protein
MIHLPDLSVFLLLILLWQSFLMATSFAPSRYQRHVASETVSSLSYSVHDEDKPILCYLIQTERNNNDEWIIPQFVCTSNPEEYAWFHGINEDRMILTDGVHDQALRCVEGESSRGVLEWECESAFQ